MKLILSRKGFDSSSGRVPSPIFKDRTMISLPIPDKNSSISYKDINQSNYNIGDIVKDLTGNTIRRDFKAHMDPDLNFSNYPRSKNWQPLLGQEKAAQGHLRNQAIENGDVFLFYGLFREVEYLENRLRYVADSYPKHVIWGWLQIDQILPVDEIDSDVFSWALYHPHFNRDTDRTNTLYISKKSLNIKGFNGAEIGGAGIFNHFNEDLLLTSPGNNTSTWNLPYWFYPTEGKDPLTYHSDMSRWSKSNDNSLLSTVGRGQEFILDCDQYTESYKWLGDLIRSNKDFV